MAVIESRIYAPDAEPEPPTVGELVWMLARFCWWITVALVLLDVWP